MKPVISKTEVPTLDPTNLLEDWALDYAAFSLKHRVWQNRFELWRKFIRS